jgi:hypothetical protein
MSGCQPDEEVARKKSLLNHLQLTPKQFLCSDQGQEAFETLALKIFQSNPFLADLGVDQIPVAHLKVFS